MAVRAYAVNASIHDPRDVVPAICFSWEAARQGMSLSEEAQQEQTPCTGKTRCCTGHRVPGYGLSLDRVPVS
jgi:hypothetical protein